MLKPEHIGVTIEPHLDGVKMVAGVDLRWYEFFAGSHVFVKDGDDNVQAFDAIFYHKEVAVRRLRNEVYGELDRPLREALALAKILPPALYRDGLSLGAAERVAVLIQEALDLMTFKPYEVNEIQVRERVRREFH